MARKRTSEDELIDDSDLFGEDYSFDDEELNEDENDEEFEIEHLSPRERKKYEKMRESIENAVVNALAEGDSDGKFYKGLQRVLAKKDRELYETRDALGSLLQRFGIIEDKAQDLDFMKNIIKDMLDDESKEIFDNKYQGFKTKREQEALAEQQRNFLYQQQMANQLGYQRYGTDDDESEAQIRQYRKQATEKLKAFAKKAGIDPNDKDLDYGTEDEPLLVRMDKLASSIEKISSEEDEEIDYVRPRQRVKPSTRTRNESAGDDSVAVGRDLISKASAQMIEKMRKMR